MSLVDLICPRCGQAMPPPPRCVIHACTGCGASWEAVAGGGLVPVNRTLVRPEIQPPTEAALYLVPVWCVAVHRDELGEVGSRMAPEIRVPATGLGRFPLLVEAARRMTRAGAPWREWSGPKAEPEAAEIDAETAFAVAEAVALRHVPGWPRDAEVEQVRIPLGGAQLVDWPCAVDGSELIELVGGIALAGALVDLARARDRRSVLGGEILRLDLPRGFTPAAPGVDRSGPAV